MKTHAAEGSPARGAAAPARDEAGAAREPRGRGAARVTPAVTGEKRTGLERIALAALVVAPLFTALDLLLSPGPGWVSGVGTRVLVEVAVGVLAVHVAFLSALALLVLAGEKAASRLPETAQRWLSIGLVAGCGAVWCAFELIPALPDWGIAVVGANGFGKPLEPGLVVVAVAASLFGAGLFLIVRRRERVPSWLLAAGGIGWLHFALGPGYLISRRFPTDVLHLVGVCVAAWCWMLLAQRIIRTSRAQQGAALAILGTALVTVLALPLVATQASRTVMHRRKPLSSVWFRFLPSLGNVPDWPGLAAPQRLASIAGPVPVRGVVLIIVDTLRADALEWSYGDRLVAPHLRAFVKGAQQWPRAYAAGPKTEPSVRAMLGGDGEPLVSELRRAGVRTAAVVAVPRLLDHVSAFEDVDESVARRPDVRFALTAPQITQSAVERFRSLCAGRDRFFLLVHYYEPHEYYVPNDMISFGGGLRERYAAEVAYVDAHIQPFLARLAGESDVATLLVSDHGEELLDHGYVSHGLRAYDETSRIVMAARVPGWGGGSTDGAVFGGDVAPTVAGLLGATGSIGPGAVPLWASPADRTVRFEVPNGWACVRGSIKWIVNTRAGFLERYDLHADPGEQVNTADEHAMPEWCAG
jgi:hypothetical protein